jgi:uncharacterized membrane protein YphA (DoxX/SURF4 family)
MNRNNIVYWTTTGLFVLALAMSGLGDLSGAMDEGIAHLGYPPILATILGVWKVLGIVALLAPGLPRLKEWAYAGFVFNLTGAAVSHIAAGDGIGGVVAPAVLFTLAMMSWATRPQSRRLGEILPRQAHGQTVRA